MKRLLLLALLTGCDDSPGSNADLGDKDLSGAADLAGPATTDRLPSRTGTGSFRISGRQESAIEVVVPDPLPQNPPLILAFHGTGGEPSEAISDFQLDVNAPRVGAVAIAPRAGYRNGVHPADVDHEQNGGDSSWNLWDLDPTSNDDLRYLAALIAAAHADWGADTTRVYTMGFSNGAFFSWFAAASLPDRIAGFGENSGGWTTNACPTRYGADSDGLAYYPTSGPAPGVTLACADLQADPQFPSACAGPLRPPPLGARVPFGYLAHYSSDDTVSVQWSCLLAAALGARAQINLRFSDADGTRGHNLQPDFFYQAWSFFALRTTAD